MPQFCDPAGRARLWVGVGCDNDGGRSVAGEGGMGRPTHVLIELSDFYPFNWVGSVGA